MKVVIFAGGLGTRLSEETGSRPKPMVQIGGMPILMHIIKIYRTQGFNDFVICLGYKGEMIKEYFTNYFPRESDLIYDNSGDDSVTVFYSHKERLKVKLIETGLNTKTAGRLKRIQRFIGYETFMLTYGDGLSSVDLNKLLEFHNAHSKFATMTTIQFQNKYGALKINDENIITEFIEKPQGNWVNGGFFVLEPDVFNYLGENADEIMWEDYPLEQLAKEGELVAFKHEGFWKCMDALRDKLELEDMWTSGKAEWKTWE